MNPGSRLLLGVLAPFLALGTWLRLRGAGEIGLYGDEYHTLFAADSSYRSILTTFDGVGSHVPLPLLQRLSLDLFGPGVLSFRLVALVPGILALLLAYPILRQLVGEVAAALATCLLSINPMFVYYSRFARGYALVLLLALILGWALHRLLDPAARRGWVWGTLVASAALLPWVHLSTLGFVLALALAGVALAVHESRAFAVRLVLAFAAAAALSLLLFLPVLPQVVTYFADMEREGPPLSWLGVPTLIAGGRFAAWVWLLALPISAAALWQERRVSLVLSLAAIAGPVALLIATNPAGLDYAWARYLLSALPFLAALVAAAFSSAARLSGLREPLVLLLGALLCLLQYGTGPLRPGNVADGGFSNTELALHSLGAFDEPFPEMPAFYRTIAGDRSVSFIVEAPPFLARGMLLYRNYALVHGREVRLDWMAKPPRGIRSKPYARPFELQPGETAYVVLHRDQFPEVSRYFDFVHDEVWPRVKSSADATLMRRFETILGEPFFGPEETIPMAARLRRRFGAPYYKDERILVWKLSR